MRLEGSCHCGAVRFACDSTAPYPFMHCYCSICRKVGGGGGSTVNLHAEADSLEVDGDADIGVYRAWLDHPTRSRRSDSERRFCRLCASMLWVWDPSWPELIHPFASAIDSALAMPPERVHIMLGSKACWVQVPTGPAEVGFDAYPEESLVQWHRRHGLIRPR